MKKILILLVSIIASFLCCIPCFSFDSVAYKSYEQISFLSETNSDYIIFHYGESAQNNDFLYLNKECSLTMNNIKIKSEILMMKSNSNYTFYNEDLMDLKENELYISKNLSKKYNLQIGDSVELKSAFSNDDKLLIIKGFLPNIYSISTEYLSSETGLIIIGENKELEGKKLQSVKFANNDEQLNSLVIDKFISNDNTIESLKRNINNALLISILISVALNAFISIFICVLNYNKFRKDIIIGFEIIDLYKRNFILQFLSSIISIITILVIKFIYGYFVIYKITIIPLYLILAFIPIIVLISNFVYLKLKMRRI